MARITKEELLEGAQATELFDLDERKLMSKTLLKRAYKHVSDPELLPEQRAVLTSFFNEYSSKVRATSVSNVFASLHHFALFVKKPFLQVDKADINSYLSDLRNGNREYSERTIVGKNVYIKQFFKWIYDENKIEYKNDYPDLVDHLSTKLPKKDLLPTQLLTPMEVRRMVEACHKLRDKTAIMALYESGCRARELTGLKIKDIKIEEFCADISIRVSKTIPRVNTLIDSYVYLRDYLNTHPYKSNPEAPFFLNESNGQWGRSLLYLGLVSIVNTAKKRARITKKVTLHLFRHSRATQLASQGWTEAQLREWFGWSRTSGTPTVYVHIGQSDIKNKILRQNGLLGDQETNDEMQNRLALKQKTCSRCGKVNPADAIACHCGFALSLASVEEIKKLREESSEFMDKLNQIPLKPEIITGKMTALEYKKELIKSDPFLRAEFEKIAKEVLNKVMVQEKQESDITSAAICSKEPVFDKFKGKVIDLRNKGWPMETIAKELGIGYGTVNKICRSEEMTKIY